MAVAALALGGPLGRTTETQQAAVAASMSEQSPAAAGGTSAVGARHAFLWQGGKLIDLGTLGGKESEAAAINERGQVVGGSDTRTGGHAFLWQGGKLTDLGTLPGSRSTLSYAIDLNAGGQIVGGTEGKPAPGEAFGHWGHGFLWQQGKLVDLGALGPTSSRVSDINDAGQIVGWSETSAGLHAFRWQGGKMTDLGTLGGQESLASATNEAGQVIGSSRLAARATDPYRHEDEHAFLWHDGAMRDLGTLGGKESFASAINERGQVVGSSEVPGGSAGQRHAFLWQEGSLRDLGTLGGRESTAWGLNERGQIVGRAQTSGGAWHAYLWQDGRMRDLGTLGGKESAATEVNERGQVIGDSTTARGATHAFLWQDGKMRDLGTLGGQSSSSAAINDLGQVVGTSDTIPPPKPPPSSPHTIAYTALDEFEGSGDPVPGVYTIHTDGSHRWRLIDDAESPVWSPDGQRIAYTWDGQVVAVARADGKQLRELSVGPSFCYQATWSPDGRQIACVAGWWEGEERPTRYRSALYAVDLRSGRERQLLPGIAEDAEPSWSPDGRRIVFDDDGIVVLDLKTKRTRRLGAGATPDWSPNGKLIAYSTGHTIALMNADGSGRRTIVTSKELVAHPSWAPDGARLVYAQFTARASTGLFIVRADGKQRRLLVRGGFEPDWRPGA
jgi:probable HAF family extracellular repeat protein